VHCRERRKIKIFFRPGGETQFLGPSSNNFIDVLIALFSSKNFDTALKKLVPNFAFGEICTLLACPLQLRLEKLYLGFKRDVTNMCPLCAVILAIGYTLVIFLLSLQWAVQTDTRDVAGKIVQIVQILSCSVPQHYPTQQWIYMKNSNAIPRCYAQYFSHASSRYS
jgi:hypothetical protein